MTSPAQEKAHWDDGAATYASDEFTQEIVKLLLRELQPGRTLEIGAGQGRITTELAKTAGIRRGFSVYGIDISTKMLAQAPKDNVQYKANDGRTIPHPNRFFDNIYSVTVFQHLPNAAKRTYIEAAYRALRPGGILFFQFIEGEHSADFDYNDNLVALCAFIERCGFEQVYVLYSHIHPQWTWIKAVRP